MENRFSIYDAMERKGIFRLNPANLGAKDSNGAPLYKGPVQYPKMFYHPQGATIIVVPAELIETAAGPKYVGEKRELVSKVVNSPEEEAALVAEGWHSHPAKAMVAAGLDAPAMSAEERLKELEEELAKLKKEKAQAALQLELPLAVSAQKKVV